MDKRRKMKPPSFGERLRSLQHEQEQQRRRRRRRTAFRSLPQAEILQFLNSTTEHPTKQAAKQGSRQAVRQTGDRGSHAHTHSQSASQPASQTASESSSQAAVSECVEVLRQNVISTIAAGFSRQGFSLARRVGFAPLRE